MYITDELRKLQQLHHEGALTDEEFASAKAAVLSGRVNLSTGEPSPAPDLAAELLRQTELQTLDREWEIERENYMETGTYGSKSIPHRGSSIIGGIIMGLFGIFWTAAAASAPRAPVVLPLFGIMFIVFGIGMSINSYQKAGNYERAQTAYRRRRARMKSSDLSI